MEEELDEHDNSVVVIVNARLRRGWLAAIQNTKIKFDTIPYLNERLLDEPRIKLVRINTMTNSDVPQYRIIDPEDTDRLTKASGIFKDPLGIYYGVGGRPVTMRGSLIEDIKYQKPSKLLLQQRAVEYIPLGPINEEERDSLANLVDQLRRIGLTYDKHTIEPYPMRIMKFITKYLTGTEDTYNSEFDDEVEVLEAEERGVKAN